MKLMVSQLRRIIKEEVSRVISESTAKVAAGVHPADFIHEHILMKLNKANSFIKTSNLDEYVKTLINEVITNANNLAVFLDDKFDDKGKIVNAPSTSDSPK